MLEEAGVEVEGYAGAAAGVGSEASNGRVVDPSIEDVNEELVLVAELDDRDTLSLSMCSSEDDPSGFCSAFSAFGVESGGAARDMTCSCCSADGLELGCPGLVEYGEARISTLVRILHGVVALASLNPAMCRPYCALYVIVTVQSMNSTGGGFISEAPWESKREEVALHRTVGNLQNNNLTNTL